MSDELTPRAVERLLAAAAPLREQPATAGVDEERYDLGQEIGRGGMGVVYAAWDRELRRKVALKVLGHAAGGSPEARERFVREARAAARLVHPGIAAVYDATPDAIAMQLIEGETLEAHPWEGPRELAALIRDAALAVHYAHEAGLIHRDLKPGNLMVTRAATSSDDVVLPGTVARAHVYVMDFGLAKERVDASGLTTSIVGTPAYMAPEQALAGEGEVGPWTDVYGLGATLYACLGGRPPIEDSDVYRAVRRIVEEDPRPLRALAPELDPDLAILVHKCLEKDPARRYPSALALAGDLDRWLRGEPIEARRASLLYRLRRYVSRRQGAFVASAAAAGVVLLCALPFVIQARAERELAEAKEALVTSTFELSRVVSEALRNAQLTRTSAGGYELTSYPILEAAIGECRRFLEHDDVGEVHFFVGQLLRQQGKAREAATAFDRAEELSGDIHFLRRERGLAFAALYRDHAPVLGGEPPEELGTWRRRGAEDLRAAVGDERGVPTLETVYARGHLAWLEGDLERAIRDLREVVELEGTHQEAHYSLSRLCLLVGRDDLAMRHSVAATDLLRGYRPAYIASAGALAESAASPSDQAPRPEGSLPRIRPERELLALDGMPELLLDFNLLLQLDPTDAHNYGLRGQVQARAAMRAHAAGALDSCVRSLRLAIDEFSDTLTLDPESAAARVDRAACRTQLARVLAAASSSSEAPALLDAALADYAAALAAAPELCVAYHDRALLYAYRARLAQLAMDVPRALHARDAARADAARALELGSDHPARDRFANLVAELDS